MHASAVSFQRTQQIFAIERTAADDTGLTLLVRRLTSFGKRRNGFIVPRMRLKKLIAVWIFHVRKRNSTAFPSMNYQLTTSIDLQASKALLETSTVTGIRVWSCFSLMVFCPCSHQGSARRKCAVAKERSYRMVEKARRARADRT